MTDRPDQEAGRRLVSNDLTPRERAAVAAGYPADITFGELREESTRAWAIVDRQSGEIARLQEALREAYTLLISAEPTLIRDARTGPNETSLYYKALLRDRVAAWLDPYREDFDAGLAAEKDGGS